jgi:di/tricarboxylate transporter
MAGSIAGVLIDIFEPFGAIGILFGVYLIANILTEFITNIAAASIAFPIAYASALSIGVDPVPFILAVAYGASASFITPIGYQTNLMVFGPGGYTFKDFLRIGVPLSLLYMVTCVFILSLIHGLI